MSRRPWLRGLGSFLASNRATNQKPNRRHRERWQPSVLQQLEARVLLSVPPPIDPTRGEAKLLSIIDSPPLRDIKNALDNFPVPFVARTDWFGPPTGSQAAATALKTVVVNNKAGAPSKIDIDDNKATGRGGFDIQIEVNTVLLPTPHLTLDITRLGSAPFVENFQVLIAFPFSAFYSGPPLPGAPNLFMGYRTLAAGGEPGGHAPAREQIDFTAGNLPGTAHLNSVTLRTAGSDNPLLFLQGHFDGTFATGALNAAAFGVELETTAHRVPQLVNIGLNVNSALIGTPINASVGIDWVASERAKATFSYIEAEELLVADADFATSLAVDQMPLRESFQFKFQPNTGVQLSHRGSSPIDHVVFRHQRRDGMLIKVEANDVPTEVDMLVNMSLAGDAAITLNVNANTMDLTMQAVQLGGFPNTSALLGFNLGYVEFGIKDAVDLTAGYVASQPIIGALVDLNRDNHTDGNDTGKLGGVNIIAGLADLNGDGHIDALDTGVLFGFNVIAGRFDANEDGVGNAADNATISGILSAFPKNPGESIKSMELIGDDDAHFEPDPLDTNNEVLVGLQLPPSWLDSPPHHIFSLIEDGTHGTVAARIVNFQQAVFQLNATDLASAYHLVTSAAAPMQAYLKFGEGSNFLQGPNDDIEAVCDIDDLPAGEVKLFFTPPTDIGYVVNPPQPIDSIHCFGHMGLANFDMALGGLPPLLAFHLDPAASFSLVAEDGLGGPATVDLFALRLSETQVAFIDGLVDINTDNVINTADDGALLSYTVIDGRLDTNGDGHIDASDIGLALGFHVIGGQVDVNGDGVISAADDASREQISPGLANTGSLLGLPLRDVRLRVDDIPSLDGTWGNIVNVPFANGAGLPPPREGDVLLDTATGATGIVHLNSPGGAVGSIQLVQVRDGSFDAGSTLDLLDRLNIKNVSAAFAFGEEIVGASSGAHATIRRFDQLAERGTLFLSNRTGTFLPGESLLVNNLSRGNANGGLIVASPWSAQVAAASSTDGFAVHVGTTAGNAFVGGVQVALSTQVGLAPLAAPAVNSAHYFTIHTGDAAVPGRPADRLEFGVFGSDEIEVTTTNSGGVDVHVAADAARPAHFLLQRDIAPGVPQAVKTSLDISNVSQSLDLSANFSSSVFDHVGSAPIDSIHAAGYLDLANFDVLISHIPRALSFHVDPAAAFSMVAEDGAGGPAVVDQLALRIWETQVAIIDGLVDINTDGIINSSDDGALLNFSIIDGQLDTTGDGAIDAADVGSVLGFDVIGGRVDANGDQAISDADDKTRNQIGAGLPGTSSSLLGRPLRDVRLRVDHIPSFTGAWGSVINVPFDNGAGSPLPQEGDILFDTVTGATGIVHLNAAGGAVGSVQLVQVRRGSFAQGSTLDLLDRLEVSNVAAPFLLDEVIVGASSGAHATIRRLNPILNRATLFFSDRTGTFTPGELLLVNGVVRATVVGSVVVASPWSGRVSAAPAADGTSIHLGTTAEDAFVTGAQLALSSEVDLAPISDPTAASPHYLRLTTRQSNDANRPAPAKLETGVFGIDDVDVTINSAGLTAEYDADSQRAGQILVHRDFAADVPRPINVQLDVDLVPQSLTLHTNFSSQFDYIASSPIDSIHSFGFVGLGNFDVDLDDLPRAMAFNINPAGSFTMLAEDGLGAPATVGQLTLRHWETQVAFINGFADVNTDGLINTNDDGPLLNYTVINGGIDTTGDGIVNADDAGLFLDFNIIGGRADINRDNVISAADDATRAQISTGLSDTAALLGRPLRDIRLRIDDIPSLDGSWGSVLTVPFDGGLAPSPPRAGAVLYDHATGATGIIRKKGPRNSDGVLQVSQLRGSGFANNSSLSLLDPIKFTNRISAFAIDDVVVGALSHARGTIRRLDEIAGRGTIYLSDRSGVFIAGEPLLVNGIVHAASATGLQSVNPWTATAAADSSVAGMAVDFGTSAEDVFLPAVQLSASTEVELAALPDPTATSAHFVHLTDVKHSLSSHPVPGRLSFGFFGIDDVSIAAAGGFEAHFDTDASRTAQFTIQSDFNGGFFKDKAIDLAVNILDVPQQIDLETNLTSRLDYSASSAINSITAVGVIDGQDDGIQNFRIISGLIDLDSDGAITDADSGLIGNQAVESGQIGGVSLDLNGDGAINSLDSHEPNGTEVLFGLVNLPAEIHLKAAPNTVAVGSGQLNVNADQSIDGDDDGAFGGIAVIDGKLDINEDGVVDDDDDGTLLGRTIINGEVDLNATGDVTASDTGAWNGVEIHMSDQIQDFELLLRSQSDELGVLGGDNRLVHIQAHNLPANWLLASFGLSLDFSATSDNGFIFETTNANGDPAPFGNISALMATSQENAKITELRRAFRQTTAGPVGAVLDGSTPSRINYSGYLQEIDAAYYQAGDADSVLTRLASLYADGAILNTDNDHVAVRQAGGTGVLTDILLHGFQKIEGNWKIVDNPIDTSFFRIIDDAHLTFKAPAAGSHPFYFGLATSDNNANDDDDGFFAGHEVINGRLDISDNSSISAADVGVIFGRGVIDGELDMNNDLVVDEHDDGFIRGIGVIDGRLDVSEQLVSLDIENVPDEITAELSIDAQHIGFTGNASAGDIDFYAGTVTIAPDETQAIRLRLQEAPRFVNFTWDANLLNGGFNVDAADEFEALILIQVPALGADTMRFVGGLHMEDIQVGYNVDLFSFDVAESFDIVIGNSVINGRIDMNGDHEINNQDDGGIDGKTIINGFVDMDGDGDITAADNGTITLFQWIGLVPLLETHAVIGGSIDQNNNLGIGGGDDYDNRIISIPTAWDLFRATAGIDNNAESSDIGPDPNNSPISGFFDVYTLRNNPAELDPDVHADTPASHQKEYVPLISTVLDNFRSLNYTVGLTLDPFSPNIVFPLSVDSSINLSPASTVIFDFWIQDVFGTPNPFVIDFPDDVNILGFEIDFPDDISIGLRFGGDYANNSPLHLFPITIFSAPNPLLYVRVETIAGIQTLTEILLHLFGDHEDPFL
ncbi:MAG TPA: hypothetical protein VGQ99_16775 [Tepidisphaeraceae bacterium]|nr:hypothetical protein [Tepidisphaeraceae bacterium]